MLRPWRPELRVGLCPTRLVLANGAPVATRDPVGELGRLGAGKRVTVILSNHFVRHALLPWSRALTSDEEWLALARHSFSTTYGTVADTWHCRVSPASRSGPRLASAIDATLLESLRALACVVSIQPYLMSAVNARRRSLARKTGWIVVQEPGRAAIALLRDGRWRLTRTRGLAEQEQLVDLLEREAAIAQDDCEDVFLYGEAEAPAHVGRYRVTDLTLAKGAKAPRSAAMTCH